MCVADWSQSPLNCAHCCQSLKFVLDACRASPASSIWLALRPGIGWCDSHACSLPFFVPLELRVREVASRHLRNLIGQASLLSCMLHCIWSPACFEHVCLGTPSRSVQLSCRMVTIARDSNCFGSRCLKAASLGNVSKFGLLPFGFLACVLYVCTYVGLMKWGSCIVGVSGQGFRETMECILLAFTL
jgi:hypothetical protein